MYENFIKYTDLVQKLGEGWQIYIFFSFSPTMMLQDACMHACMHGILYLKTAFLLNMVSIKALQRF